MTVEHSLQRYWYTTVNGRVAAKQWVRAALAANIGANIRAIIGDLNSDMAQSFFTVDFWFASKTRRLDTHNVHVFLL